MAIFNQFTFIGRVTADLEAPRQAGKSQVVKVRMVVSQPGKKDGSGNWIKDENPNFIDVEFWQRENGKGPFEVAVQFLSKGSEILVSGSLEMDSWLDKTDGSKRSKHKVRGDSIQLLGDRKGGDAAESKPAAQPQRGQQSQPTASVPMTKAEEESLPF